MLSHDSRLGAARAVFTDRELGNVALHVPDDVEQVRARRARLAAELDRDPDEVLYLDQVHGIAVAQADELPQGGPAPAADAAVSATGRPLAIMVADCIPVLLEGSDPLDPRVHVTGAAHAGRRGLLDGVLPAVVEAMRARGAVEIRALLGPSICGACYEVPEDMAQESELAMPGIRTTTAWGTPALDLPAAALAQLRELGVRAERVEVPGGSCTRENLQLSSHRRDPASGRIVGIITA